MLDDYQDNALIRYGKPTWHTLPNIGRNVGLHAVLTESCWHFLLQKYFKEHPQYTKILDTFLRAMFFLNYSQFLDVVPFCENNLSEECLHVSYFGKAEETVFTTSTAVALYLAGIENPEIHHKVKSICQKFGKWLQMQVSYIH